MMADLEELRQCAGGVLDQGVWSSGLGENAPIDDVKTLFKAKIVDESMCDTLTNLCDQVEKSMQQNVEARNMAGEASRGQIVVGAYAVSRFEGSAGADRASSFGLFATTRLQMRSNLLRSVYVRAEAALSGK